MVAHNLHNIHRRHSTIYYIYAPAACSIAIINASHGTVHAESGKQSVSKMFGRMPLSTEVKWPLSRP